MNYLEISIIYIGMIHIVCMFYAGNFNIVWIWNVHTNGWNQFNGNCFTKIERRNEWRPFIEKYPKCGYELFSKIVS